MHSTQELELFSDHRVTQMLFKEVKNAAELRQCAVEGKINGALINPTMVSHSFFIYKLAKVSTSTHNKWLVGLSLQLLVYFISNGTKKV